MNIIDRMARALAAQRKLEDKAIGLPTPDHMYDPPLPMDRRSAEAVWEVVRPLQSAIEAVAGTGGRK